MVSSTPVITSHVDPTDPSEHLEGQQSFHIHVGTVQLIMSRTFTGFSITSISQSSKMLNRSLTDTNTLNTQKEVTQRSGKAISTTKIRSSSKVNQINEDFQQYKDQLKWTKDRQQKTIKARVQSKTYQDQSRRVRSTKPLQSSKK